MLSFTDCTSFALMKRIEVARVLGTDGHSALINLFKPRKARGKAGWCREPVELMMFS